MDCQKSLPSKGDSSSSFRLAVGEHSTGQGVQLVDIIFRDLTVTVRAGAHILSQASGRIRAGTLSALLGPSGAGKTTLLDVLAGRSQARVQGQVWYGQQRLRPAVRRQLLAYVEQEDALVPNLTALEQLQYVSELRSPPGTPAALGRARAEEVLEELGLQGCRNTLIGGGSSRRRGVSGGQRRRISIGVALVSHPAVVLLDEPTSGLDSRAALEVVEVLRAQADRGLTILASIHQPAERLLARFDEVLMAAGGLLVYQGGNGEEARSYLQRRLPKAASQLDSELPLPDWLLDCLEQAVRTGELLEQSGELAPPALAASSSAERLATQGAAPDATRARRKGFLACCGVLVKYRTRADYRSPVFLLPRIVDKLAMAFLMGTLFWGGGQNDTPTYTYNTVNMLFMWIMLPGFSAAGFIPALMLETELFVRERHTGLYPILSYLLAKMAGELTVVLPTSAVLAAMVWFMTRLSGNFLLFWLPYLVSMAIGVAIAYLCAALSPTLDICILALAGYVISVLFFTGLIINWRDIPGYWAWFADLSYMRYAWGAVMINEFAADPRAFGTVPVLSYFALDSQSAWGMLGLQCAFFFAFVLLAWGALAAREALPRWRAAIAGRCWGQRRKQAAPDGSTHAGSPRPAQPVVISVPEKADQGSPCV